ALHRLRKILKTKNAVQLVNGSLSLNKDVVWLDTGELERISLQGPASPELRDHREELLELYRAGLLASEEVHGSVLAARQRLRGRFVRSIAQCATQLEQARRWEELTSLYLRALDREPGEESLARGLARAFQMGGQATRTSHLREPSAPRGRATST
ncbi:MAG TPA: bacterial transcriptional activator domain-containing protein, partial [Steroidobacteraceae bacterium]|nr:bacterial transcriptional activator domain-containing protein [Steroidobacteraceae bacterium]